jgi:hypothetical protein
MLCIGIVRNHTRRYRHQLLVIYAYAHWNLHPLAVVVATGINHDCIKLHILCTRTAVFAIDEDV